MPELPEVEVLVRHLARLVRGRKVRRIRVLRAKVIAPCTPARFKRILQGATFQQLSRRGKYLLFRLRREGSGEPFTLVGHLGMTGRIYLAAAKVPLPKHASVVLHLGRENLLFEDTRYFGRLTLDTGPLAALGPEPLEDEFDLATFRHQLKRSRRPIKVKLLDQSLVAGLGNIYASEALFRAQISPRVAARRLRAGEVSRLWRSIRETLAEAIACGSTVPLNFARGRRGDRLFYFGRAPGAPDSYEERLRVYDRAGQPCPACRHPIRRIVQAGRSTFFCPHCQHG